MLKARLLEIEAELLAKEEAGRLAQAADLPPRCELLLQALERELAPPLAAAIGQDWRGFLTYRRAGGQLIICRGRSFKESGMFGKWRAGLDVPNGLDTVTEYLRKFDVSPPQGLDHLMVNFGQGENVRVFLWYGENISPYRLIFESDVTDDAAASDDSTEAALDAAVGEALGWVVNKPRHMTLPEFLKR